MNKFPMILKILDLQNKYFFLLNWLMFLPFIVYYLLISGIFFIREFQVVFEFFTDY